MQLVIYFLDKVAGSLHSSPDGEVSVEGPRAAQIAHTVEHHHEETGLVGDDLLRYVAGRMRGYWTAEEVEEPAAQHAEDDPPQQPRDAGPRDFRQAQVNNQATNYQRQQDNEAAARQSQSQPPHEEPVVPEQTEAPYAARDPIHNYLVSANLADRTDRAMLADALEEAGRDREAKALRSNRRLEVGTDGRLRQSVADRDEHDGNTNYATWAVALTLQNEYKFYQTVNRLFETKPDADSHDLEQLVRRLLPRRGPVDFEGDASQWENVDWEDVLDSVRPS